MQFGRQSIYTYCLLSKICLILFSPCKIPSFNTLYMLFYSSISFPFYSLFPSPFPILGFPVFHHQYSRLRFVFTLTLHPSLPPSLFFLSLFSLSLSLSLSLFLSLSLSLSLLSLSFYYFFFTYLVVKEITSYVPSLTWPSMVSNTLPALRSRWMTLWSCRNVKARRVCWVMHLICGSVRGFSRSTMILSTAPPPQNSMYIWFRKRTHSMLIIKIKYTCMCTFLF